MNTARETRKVVVVGAGDVGATFAYALLQSGTAESIVLVDARKAQAEGQASDLAHGLPFVPSTVVRAGSADDYVDAAVIVITAGTKQKTGESRLDLLRRNILTMNSIVDEIAASKSEAVIVVVANPVDVLTYAALKRSRWPRHRIFGSGTVLDSARFRYLLSAHCGVDVRNVHAYILGEHGDSEVPIWSMTHLAGMAMDDYCPACQKCVDWLQERNKIVTAVRDSAYHIIDAKGSTCYAIGLALVRIVNAILRDEHSVLTVSTLLDEEYGSNYVCLSGPCNVCQAGAERIIVGRWTDEKQCDLVASAMVLKKMLTYLAGADGKRGDIHRYSATVGLRPIVRDGERLHVGSCHERNDDETHNETQLSVDGRGRSVRHRNLRSRHGAGALRYHRRSDHTGSQSGAGEGR